MGSKQVSDVHHSLTTQEVVDGPTFPNFCIFISFWCTSHLIRPSPLKRGFCNLSDPEFTSIWCSCFTRIRTPTYWLKSCVKEIWFTYLRCKSPTTQHNCVHAQIFTVPPSVLLVEEVETRLTDGSDTTTTCTFSLALSSPLSLRLFTLEVEEKRIAWFCILW